MSCGRRRAARSPNVRGDLSHLLAEDSGRVGIVQQSPRVSFERLAGFPNKWGVELENFDPLRSVEAMPRRNEQRIFDGMIALASLLPKMCWRSSRTLGSGSASGRRVHFMPM
jgi:hypothetical protein